MVDNMGGELPNDIISEIFSKSSLSNLGKFRTLSKECNATSYDNRFTQSIGERRDIAYGVFVHSWDRKSRSSYFISSNADKEGNKDYAVYDFKFLPAKEFKILACNKIGYLICEAEGPKRVPSFYVCKPTTREWMEIRKPKTRYFTVSWAMITLSSKRYKIIRLSINQRCSNLRWIKSEDYLALCCEVYDSKTERWKTFERDVLLPYAVSIRTRNRPPVSTGGAAYWSLTSAQLLAFHASTSANEDYWTLLDLPFPMCTETVNVVEYCGQLGLISELGGVFELWVMEGREGNVWSRRKRWGDLYGLPRVFFSSDASLNMGPNHHLQICNLANGEVRKLKLPYTNHYDRHIYTFHSDYCHANLNPIWRRLWILTRTWSRRAIKTMRRHRLYHFLFC